MVEHETRNSGVTDCEGFVGPGDTVIALLKFIGELIDVTQVFKHEEESSTNSTSELEDLGQRRSNCGDERAMCDHIGYLQIGVVGVPNFKHYLILKGVSLAVT